MKKQSMYSWFAQQALSIIKCQVYTQPNDITKNIVKVSHKAGVSTGMLYRYLARPDKFHPNWTTLEKIFRAYNPTRADSMRNWLNITANGRRT